MRIVAEAAWLIQSCESTQRARPARPSPRTSTALDESCQHGPLPRPSRRSPRLLLSATVLPVVFSRLIRCTSRRVGVRCTAHRVGDGRRHQRPLPEKGTDQIRAEIHSKGSTHALRCSRAGLRGAGEPPAAGDRRGSRQTQRGAVTPGPGKSSSSREEGEIAPSVVLDVVSARGHRRVDFGCDVVQRWPVSRSRRSGARPAVSAWS